MPRLAHRWTTPYWRHTLEEWAGMVTGAGFAIAGLHEPRPTAEQVARVPALDDCRRLPYFLVWRAARP